MEFEFDPAKSEANREKHGIDFVEAQLLWLDSMLLEIPARTSDEPRFFVIGKIGNRVWSAVITYREDRIRIISVRRSRKEEVEIYEGE
ncbi:MAG: BrnT family toxin [Candidatus Krumholzibacteriia bacterium]